MMKKLLYIAILGSFSLQVQCQTKPAAQHAEQPVITIIEFTTLTRGQQKQVFISADSVTEITDGRENESAIKKQKLEDGKWEELLSTIRGVKLEEIPKLPSPTNRRAFDGARHSTLKITTSDGRDFVHTFDDENPHKALHALMDKILELVGPMR